MISLASLPEQCKGTFGQHELNSPDLTRQPADTGRLQSDHPRGLLKSSVNLWV